MWPRSSQCLLPSGTHCTTGPLHPRPSHHHYTPLLDKSKESNQMNWAILHRCLPDRRPCPSQQPRRRGTGIRECDMQTGWWNMCFLFFLWDWWNNRYRAASGLRWRSLGGASRDGCGCETSLRLVCLRPFFSSLWIINTARDSASNFRRRWHTVRRGKVRASSSGDNGSSGVWVSSCLRAPSGFRAPSAEGLDSSCSTWAFNKGRLSDKSRRLQEKNHIPHR